MTREPVVVNSVLGPTAVDASALVDAYAHTWIDTPAHARAAGLPVLMEQEGVERELREFRSAGGRAVIDCQPPFCGRDVERMSAISRGSDVAVVAATGFHLPVWYAPGSPPWSWTRDEAFEFFLSELNGGVAGVIKAAHDGARRGSDVAGLLGAAAAAAAVTGAPLVVHTERGEEVEELAATLIETNLRPQQVLLCHVDKAPDFGLHRELAVSGFRLEYDTFVRPKYAPDTGVWPLVERMVQEGLATAVAVGLDLAEPELWGFRGGPGLRALTHDIPGRLRALGLDEIDVRTLCGGTALNLIANRWEATE